MAQTQETSNRPNLGQRRAQHAYRAVRNVSQNEFAKFLIEARKLPMRIRTAGLGHALAFLEAKDEVPALKRELSRWVLWDRYEKQADNTQPELLQEIVGGTSLQLRRWTDESLAYLEWLTRFAEARNKETEKASSQSESSTSN